MNLRPAQTVRIRRSIARRAAVGAALLLSLRVAVLAHALTYYSTYTLSGGTATQTSQTYNAEDTDTSAVWVSDDGNLTLTNCTITTSGDTSSQDNSSFYGLNAGILVTEGTLNMFGGSVTTTGTGANGVFATGADAEITLTGVAIDASNDGGHAVMATQGGTMTVIDVDMTTAGKNSGAIATDRGSGTITVIGGTVTTSGEDSPGIYSTGEIKVTGATINATGAEAAVIEGENSITLVNTNLSSSLDDKWGVLIYQSMSGDAEGTEGTFTMTGGTLANTATSGPLFFVTNSTGIITLSGVTVTAASGTLVEAGGTSRWGTSGSNGGTVEFTADAVTLAGDFVTDDDYSEISIELKNNTTLTGTINAAALSLDATSTWTVTDTSYLTVFSDTSGISGTSITNIIGNGNDVYYDVTLDGNSALDGETYDLVNGGQLIPQSGSDDGDSDDDTSDLSGLCGAGCGAGTFTALPFTALCIGGMKWRQRRR